MDENQSFLREYSTGNSSSEPVLNKLGDVEEIAEFVDLEDLSERVPAVSDDVTPKNSKLGDKLYRTFGYPSKVYYKDISRFIESYSDEGDVVLDPMCGSGATGLAALNSSRKAIINDGSPLAHFASKNILYPAESHALQTEFRDLKKSIKSEIDALYEVECHCCGQLNPTNSIFQSDVYECPECGREYPLYGNKTDKKSTYQCPHCDGEMKTSVPENKHKHRVERRKPIEAKYKCRDCTCGDGVRHNIAVNESVLSLWEERLKQKKEEYAEVWIPQDRIVTDRWYTRENSWPGFDKDSRVVDLFTERNRLALGILNDAIEQIDDSDVRSQLKFNFVSSLIRSSNRMYETSVVKTYYQIPSVGKVQNAWTVFERKFNTLHQSCDLIREITPLSNSDDLLDWVRVLNQNARSLPLPDDSIDYVFLDPPYGSQVGYYELNLFYSAWLRDRSENFDDEVIIPMETDDDPEYAQKWGDMMTPILREAKRTLKPGRYLTLLFHSKSDEIWNELRRIMFEELDMRYIGYLDSERGTTIHTNRLSDTNLKSAYITFQKREGDSNVTLQDDLSEDEYSLLEKKLAAHMEENEDYSFRQLRDEVVRIVHEEQLGHIPSEEEINALVKSITSRE